MDSRDDELHPREADPVDRKPGGLEGEIGVAEVDHDARARARQSAEVDALDLERHGALIDLARVALGAGHGHRLPVGQRRGRALGADHGGNAQLAGDDGGVAGAAAAVGDDGRRRLHHRLPVGRGGVGDQHLAGAEGCELVGVGHHPHRAGGDAPADGAAGGQDRPLPFQREGFHLQRADAREATVSGRACTM